MGATTQAILDRLAALIAGVDPNIGRVHSVHRRWATERALIDGAGLTLAPGGVLDDATRVGQRVLRFWTLEATTTTRPLTNASAEAHTAVTVRGFYQFEDGDAQETTLRAAAVLLLDVLNARQTGRETLNTGPGFLGYLNTRPRMEGPVMPASIAGTAVQGYSVEIALDVFEEVES